MVAQKRILIQPPFTTWFFYEHDCNICRYVLSHVMEQLQAEGWIDIRLIDINSNKGSPETYWFYTEYTEKKWGGDATTPTIRVIDRYWQDGRIREDPVNVFHLWDTDKGDFVTEEDVGKTEMLRKQIIESVNNYRRKCFNNFHDLKRKSTLMLPRRNGLLAGSF